MHENEQTDGVPERGSLEERLDEATNLAERRAVVREWAREHIEQKRDIYDKLARE